MARSSPSRGLFCISHYILSPHSSEIQQTLAWLSLFLLPKHTVASLSLCMLTVSLPILRLVREPSSKYSSWGVCSVGVIFYIICFYILLYILYILYIIILLACLPYLVIIENKIQTRPSIKGFHGPSWHPSTCDISSLPFPLHLFQRDPHNRINLRHYFLKVLIFLS